MLRYSVCVSAILIFNIIFQVDSESIIDPINNGDVRPLRRRQAPPEPLSEAEASLKALTAAYQATRARDSEQLRDRTARNEDFWSLHNIPKVYDSTKGVEGITTNVKVYSYQPTRVNDNVYINKREAVDEYGYFPKNVPKIQYSPSINTFHYNNLTPKITIPEVQPTILTTATPGIHDISKDVLEMQSFVLPPPKVQHYEKIWPLGKLHYRTLGVAVERQHELRNNGGSQTIQRTPQYYQQYYQNEPVSHQNNYQLVDQKQGQVLNDYFSHLESRVRPSNVMSSTEDNNLAQIAFSRAFKALQNKNYN